MKRYTRAAISGVIVGAIALGSAVAGMVVTPPPRVVGADPASVAAAAGIPLATTNATSVELGPEDVDDVAGLRVRAPKGGPTPDGTFLVGAARVNIAPAPTDFGGERWQTEGCTAVEEGQIDQDHVIPSPDPDDPMGTADGVRGWPAASPDCVYLGGFGIGPVRPAQRVGQGGVWIRAIAISNGVRTFVYQIADLVGWFARYDPTICVDCGIRDVRGRLATDLGVETGDVVVASTHSHATADTYGGWGGIPDWYRSQIRDSAIAAGKQAVRNLVPATLSVM